MEPRRFFLSRLAGLPLLAMAAGAGAQAQVQGQTHKPLKIMMKSAWGSDDPTKAAFPFSHGLALAEAGHEVQIFLLGEAVVLMRKVVAEAVTPVGWPKVAETLDKLAARHIPIYACGACSRARGVTEADLSNYGAKYGNPTIFCFSRRVGRQSDHRIVALPNLPRQKSLCSLASSCGAVLSYFLTGTLTERAGA
jgi:sulfur relay (sulfurtransferase) complex TusBCD TusD component (DsrE family)